jgi:hypothetical protein
MRSSCVSIEKSRQRLGYAPRFSSARRIDTFHRRVRDDATLEEPCSS